MKETQHQQKSESNAKPEAAKKPLWEAPCMEEVSDQVMAQPYIRFT